MICSMSVYNRAAFAGMLGPDEIPVVAATSETLHAVSFFGRVLAGRRPIHPFLFYLSMLQTMCCFLHPHPHSLGRVPVYHTQHINSSPENIVRLL